VILIANEKVKKKKVCCDFSLTLKLISPDQPAELIDVRGWLIPPPPG
jgi:hypothetical protein